MTQSEMGNNGAWDFRVIKGDDLWLAYYDANRLLRLRSPSGDERLIVPEERGQAPSGLTMTSGQEGVGILWRDKHPVKGLYLLDSARPDMAPLEIGGDSEPLARFQALELQDHLHFLWYGEKLKAPTGAQHNLYYRNLTKSTGALSDTALLMPGIYPMLSGDEAGNLMAYSWVTTGTVPQIQARYRPADAPLDAPDGGFRPAVTIADVPELSPIFQSFTSGSRWLVTWLAQYGLDKRDFLIEGAYSDDAGVTWSRFAIEELRGFDAASIQVAADAQGHIAMAVSARQRKGEEQAKLDIYFVRSDDRGATWSKPVALRELSTNLFGKEPPEGLLQDFHARNPVVTFGQKPGEVLVVWEDWRTIRSSLYANYSTDYGKTWALSNVALPREPGTNLGLRYEPNAVFSTPDGFSVIAEQPDSDGFYKKRLVSLTFSAEALATLAKQQAEQPAFDPKAQETAVRARAEAYWKAMVAKDFASSYALHDPFFRARMQLQTYLSTMGKIKYSHAEVKGVKFRGPRAEVTTLIRASVPKFRVPSTGEVIEKPETEVETVSTWLWIDGDWYHEFLIESRDLVFTLY